MKSIEGKTSLIIDLSFALVFMPLLIISGPGRLWLSASPLFFALACAYFYLVYFVLKRINIPALFIARQFRRIALTLGVSVTLTWMLTLFPLPELDFVTPNLTRFQTSVRNHSVALNVWLVFSMTLCYYLTTACVLELYSQLLQKRRIEAQRDKAELAMFKAQISPHFLFNTLNSLYSLVIGTSQKAEDAFIKFTEILKYTYVTIENETVPVGEEIRYIGNYIDLQAIRLNSHTAIHWHHEADNELTPIPPMLMLTFVENAFKYGSSASRDCTICISLVLHQNKLHFETANSIMRHADEFRSEGPKGMENCRARLNALYPGRHTLVTDEKDNLFRVSLDIDL